MCLWERSRKSPTPDKPEPRPHRSVMRETSIKKTVPSKAPKNEKKMKKQELIETYKRRLESREKTEATDRVDYCLCIVYREIIKNLENLDDIPEGYGVLSEEWVDEHKCRDKSIMLLTEPPKYVEFIKVSDLQNLLIPSNPQSKKSEITTGKQSNHSRFNAILNEMADLYAKKNSDYGDSFGDNFNKYGLISAVVRMSDKLNRIENFIYTDYQVDEKLKDTLIDLANYSIMTILELEKETK